MKQNKARATYAIAGILLVSLFANQYLASPQSSENTQARGIASVSDKPENYASQVKWEHQLANHIGNDRRAVASLSVKPSQRDDLLFGILAGRYEPRMKNGRMAAVEFSGKAQGLPVDIENREKFLMKYKNLWSADFARVQLESKDSQRESYDLISSSGEKMGVAELDFDQDGHFLSVKFNH